MKLSVWVAIAAVALVMLVARGLPTLLNSAIDSGVGFEPPILEGCSVPAAWRSNWSPKIVGATSEVRSSYNCAGRWLHVYVVQYTNQSPEAEALSDGQRLVPDPWANRTVSSTSWVAPDFPVNQHLLRAGGEAALLWSWYAIGDKHYRTRWSAKLAEVTNALLLRPQPVAILAVATDRDSNADALVHRADQLWKWYLAQLSKQQRDPS